MKPTKCNIWQKKGGIYTFRGERVKILGPDINDHFFITNVNPTKETFFSVKRKFLSN